MKLTNEEIFSSKERKEIIDRYKKKEELMYRLARVMDQEPHAKEVQDIIGEHYQYMKSFGIYPIEQYKTIGDLYALDERMMRHCDKYKVGFASFFKDAIHIFVGNDTKEERE